MRRHIAVVTSLALAAAAVGAQMVSSDPSHSMAALTNIRVDPASRAASSKLFTSLQELRRSEDAYYARRGHYTADRLELPEYRPPAGASVFVTAGSDWMTIRGEVKGVTVQQITVWRDGDQRTMSGSFSTE
jgi:hypothetical protein